jgi:hypothetical protein
MLGSVCAAHQESVWDPEKKQSGVSSCGDSTRGCRTRSFSDDYANVELVSLRSFVYLPSSPEPFTTPRANDERCFCSQRSFEEEAASRDPPPMQVLASSVESAGCTCVHSATGQPNSRLQGLQSSRNVFEIPKLAGDQSNWQSLCSRGGFSLDDEIAMPAGTCAWMPLVLVVLIFDLFGSLREDIFDARVCMMSHRRDV